MFHFGFVHMIGSGFHTLSWNPAWAMCPFSGQWPSVTGFGHLFNYNYVAPWKWSMRTILRLDRRFASRHFPAGAGSRWRCSHEPVLIEMGADELLPLQQPPRQREPSSPSVDLFTFCMDSVVSVFQWFLISVLNSIHAHAAPDLAVGAPRAGRCALWRAPALSWSISSFSEIRRWGSSCSFPKPAVSPRSPGVFRPGIVLKDAWCDHCYQCLCFLAPSVDRAKRRVCVCTHVHMSTHVEMASAHWCVPSQHCLSEFFF